MVAISSPSGGGKTTVIKQLLQDKELPFVYSVSMTTRAKRNGETDGVHYHFVTDATFRELVERNELLEYETVHDHLYGTPKGPLLKWLKEGKIVLLDVDVYGALNLREQFPDDSLLIFLKPPDMETLIRRLKDRSTETDQQINRRLERVAEELSQEVKFDKTVVNNNLDAAVSKVKKIIKDKLEVLNG